MLREWRVSYGSVASGENIESSHENGSVVCPLSVFAVVCPLPVFAAVCPLLVFAVICPLVVDAGVSD